jgi:hypothetical protein
MRRLSLLPLWFCIALVTLARAGELPAYLTTALGRLGTEPPAGWACTLTTRRDGRISVERYDPSLPAGQQWTLQQTDGRPPTAQEADRYQRYRVTTNATAPHPVFQRGDIDVGSAQLVREDGREAEYRFRFREGLSDTLLAHLQLTLVVDKALAAALKCTLQLTAPYSPVIGLKVDLLDVMTDLQPPQTGRPQLPALMVSRFHGRFLYFKEIQETLVITYSDFEPVKTLSTSPSGG